MEIPYNVAALLQFVGRERNWNYWREIFFHFDSMSSISGISPFPTGYWPHGRSQKSPGPICNVPQYELRPEITNNKLPFPHFIRKFLRHMPCRRSPLSDRWKSEKFDTRVVSNGLESDFNLNWLGWSVERTLTQKKKHLSYEFAT